MPNALARETSPYLLQHRDNPVDWLPWGDEALTRARELDRPLLVSIGYSSCHWCHVMERESFEDAETAALMNERFVCVKVDREERPDVDALYMDAVQAMTGHGGWPLNVFLTPEQAPFYGGTYFPPEARMGMPSWRQVLGAVAEAWDTQREEIRAQGEQVAPRLAGGALLTPSEQPLDGRRARRRRRRRCARASTASTAAGAARRSSRRPRSSSSCSRATSSSMALQTLRSMAGGGIFDQVGGGFSRYSVDARWTVPHFEKMLYDNALLARAYLHGFQASGDALLRRTAEETLDWALREMRAPEGGFYSALDADSEGVEGKFYVWSLDELRAALGDDADAAIAWFGATERGNFEGAEHPRVARARAAGRAARRGSARRLLDVRAERVRPGLDDKRLAAWNALMIAALADAGAVLGREDYLDAARGAAAFVLDAHARRPTAACCAPSTPARRGWAPTSRTTPSCSRRCSSSTRRPSRSAGSSRRARWPTRSSRASATPSAAASSRPPTTTRRSSPGARTSRTRRSRRARSSAALGLLRLAALTGERAYEEQAAGPARAAARGRRAPPGRLRPPAAGARPLPRAAARGGAGRRPGGRRGAGGRRPRGAPAAPRARGRPGRRDRPRWRSWSSARPSTAAPRPTCASASPAARRSPSPTSCARCCAELTGAGPPGARSGSAPGGTRARDAPPPNGRPVTLKQRDDATTVAQHR